ncbi:unnamed protein product [Acanthosepion pharaonis]|uniref:Uncharacterized protein n=1 Tax=Acanthosepion pharaonis TaxID=158019 RepID=A0A812BIN4_ACAPH|nr:unnamed protein product [Sepia pharaonis]
MILLNHFRLPLIPLRAHYTFVVYRHAAYTYDSPHHFRPVSSSLIPLPFILILLIISVLSLIPLVVITLSSSVDMQLTLLLIISVFSDSSTCITLSSSIDMQLIILLIFRFSIISVLSLIHFFRARLTLSSSIDMQLTLMILLIISVLSLIPLRAHYTFVVYRHAAYIMILLIISVLSLIPLRALHFVRRLSTCMILLIISDLSLIPLPYILMILLIISVFSLILLRAHYTFVVYRHAAYTYDSPHHFVLSLIPLRAFRRLSTYSLHYDSLNHFRLVSHSSTCTLHFRRLSTCSLSFIILLIISFRLFPYVIPSTCTLRFVVYRHAAYLSL